MRLTQELRSHLHYKIVLPFLLLTLLVALAGSTVSFLLITGSAQERLNNQLAQTARSTSDAFVKQEIANLNFLREIALAGANPATGAPAVADALAAGDHDGLAKALDPYFRVSIERPGVRLDRLIVFDTMRRSLIDWERLRDSSRSLPYSAHPVRDISALWFVDPILSGRVDNDGDKFAGLLDLFDGDARYFFTVAPIIAGDHIVGGLLIATRLDMLLQDLSSTAQSAIMAVAGTQDGKAFAASFLPVSGLAALDVPAALLPTIGDLSFAQNQSIFDTVEVDRRSYQVVYVPLTIRGSVIGILSIALSSDYVVGPWSDARLPLTLLTLVLMLTIIGLGIFIARQITRPLQELVTTAQAVIGGDLGRRSTVTVHDEVGLLSESFNDMTAHLLDLYSAMRAEASQRAAIVESITDGVVVCDLAGAVVLLNRAARVLLGLQDQQPGPSRFAEIPLLPIDESRMPFGETQDQRLFALHDRIVRVAAAPVAADADVPLGEVYVLQDLTREVAIDRAKTNFIATISHELRTPLTVLVGNSDLLLRNIVGSLNDQQRPLIDMIRSRAVTMTGLLNNVILIAALDAGSLTCDIEAVPFREVLDEVVGPIRSALTAKGVALVIDIPDALPDLLADSVHVQRAVLQLLDNARRYTTTGTIGVHAWQQDEVVCVDVRDTGCGITDEIRAHLFERFARGPEGMSSEERGMGLGLVIAQQLIMRQGGTLWLERTSECGSTFRFTLPCVYETAHFANAYVAAAT